MKYKLLRLSLLSMFAMLFGGLAQAADPAVTLDFTKKTNWDIPDSGTNKDEATFTNGTYSIKLFSTTNYKMNDGYLILGKANSYLELPAFSFDVEKIEIVGTSGASGSVKQNIYVGEKAVSTETTGAQSVTNAYAIAESYQAAGNVYKIMVTSAHNTQISKIFIYKKEASTDTRTATALTLTFVDGVHKKEGVVGDELELPQVKITAGETEIKTLPTWSSSDPTVADYYEGKVKLYKAGTTTMTANYAGDATYKPSSDSYELTVTEGTAEPDDYNYVYDFTEQVYTAKKETKALGTVDWSLETTCDDAEGYFSFDSNKGQQFGSAKKSAKALKLFTTGITGKIKKILVNASGAADIAATLSVTVGESGFVCNTKNSVSLTSNATDYVFTGDASGLVVLTFEQTSSKAIYIKSIKIQYEEAESQPTGFRDIKADLTQLQSLATESDVYVKVEQDGSIIQADNADEAAATLKGKWHGTSYGWSNFEASVPVPGCVKITYATHDYGNDIVVTNEAGAEVAKLNTQGAKWSSNHENVVVAYYRTNEPTTLHFSKANYNPYFAVEAIDPADLPAEVTKYNVTFAKGDATGEAPAAIEVNAGEKFSIPANYTLYKEGFTLTGWNDGTDTYKAGAQIEPTADMALTPVFTANTVTLADRTDRIAIDFELEGYNDKPKYNFNGNSGIMVTQVTIGEAVIDVKADVDATSGKFAYNGSGWHQVNAGTKVTVPSCKGATIIVETYNDATSVDFNGAAGTVDGIAATYTAESADATLTINQNANNYWNKLSIFMPKPEQGEEPEPEEKDITGTWDFSNQDIMSAVMGSSGSAQTEEVEAMEKNGLKMVIEANGAAFRNNGNNIQVGKGAIFKIPVKNAGDLVTVKGYPDYSKYTIGNSTEVLTNENTYKAKLSDAEAGYVAVTSADANNYYYLLSVTQYAKKEKATLDNEEATIDFAFDLGTEDQKASFSTASYFLSSKVTYGSNLTLKDKNTLTDAETQEKVDMTRFEPATKLDKADEASAVRFSFMPKPGLTFKPTKVSLKASRYGTDNGLIDVTWEVANGDNIVLATAVKPERNNKTPNISKLAYEVKDAVATEGMQTLLLHLYSLQETKQFGLCNIVIEGVLNGTEKEVPILASFKINDYEYAVEDVFGEQYEATLKLSKKEVMVSAENPLTDVTAISGEIGTITYEGNETACKVTIPLTAGETQMDYVLNVIQKPDYTLSYMAVDGTTVLKTQTVEEDGTIGEFAYNIADVASSKDGYKARGWFKQDYVGEKYATTDVVKGDIKLYAVETEIEAPSDSKKYVFDLTNPFFYAEDHEAFNSVGNGHYHNNHGWVFGNGDKVELLVGAKASIMLTLCAYSADTNIEASNGATVAAKVATDGGMGSLNYEGEAGTLTLTFNGTTYVHGITILNTSTTNYEREGNKFIVKAGDASSFIDALDAVNGQSGTDEMIIYLPNGTYDLGTACLTTVGRNNVTILGESQDGVIIVNKPTAEGIGVTATLLNTSEYLTLEKLTLKNAYPYYDPATGKAAANAGRAVCLQDKGNYTVCRNVTMLSYQDTYYSANNNAQFFFKDCEIHGLVDFVCGGGDVYFETTTFYLESREMTEGVGGVTIAAPNGGKSFGYVMNSCIVDCHSKEFNWGRAWGSYSGLLWMNTILKQPSKIVSSRFTAAGMNAAADAFFEYNTIDENGNVLSPASNIVKFTHSTGDKEYETILTSQQAERYSKATIFGSAPEEFKKRINIEETVGIKMVDQKQNTVNNAIYNLNGQRVEKPAKGLYIIGNKKVFMK